jgi:FADH2 O2-dependent halogenase
MRGLKRGFSYFQHRAGEPFAPQPERGNELLVAASPDDERGDTHWLRSDFDHFLVQEVQAAGIPYLDKTQITRIDATAPWDLTGERAGRLVRIAADFIIDASGAGAVLARALGIPNELSAIRTNSRCIFGHFEGVRCWQEVYTQLGGDSHDHPFGCDAAALHHVFDGGWMYVLRFDNGVTSAGFSLDPLRFPIDERVTAADEWSALLNRFPAIKTQFERAVALMPLRRTGRLQRRYALAAGPTWAMLPTAAGIIDALHSTGNAHTLTGIERLFSILSDTTPGDVRNQRLKEYERAVLAEIDLIDTLVHGCYETFSRFEMMTAFTMLYFAAATFSEHQRRSHSQPAGAGFLLSHDANFRAILARAHREACRIAARPHADRDAAQRFADEIAAAIRPYNIAGLCDPAKRNLYPYVCP